MTAEYRPGDEVPSIYDRIHAAIQPNGELPSSFPCGVPSPREFHGPTVLGTASAATTIGWQRLICRR